MKKLLLLAGEESGVLYANQIAANVRTRFPDVEIRGYGDYGFETGDLAVFGIFAVLRRIFFFLRVKRTMQRAIDEWCPDVVCTIDYPGMNLKLAAYAKQKGVRAVHVVCPQVWAWHQGRIPKIEASLDKLCCFFPFEPKIFKPGFAEFVGHPLVEAGIRNEELGIRNGGRVVAILPGSRLGEIEKILPMLLEAANEIAVKFPDVKFAIPAANAKAKRKIEEIIHHLKHQTSNLKPRGSWLVVRDSWLNFKPQTSNIKPQTSNLKPQTSNLKPQTSNLKLAILDGGARALLEQAECAVVASGTATLEAALVRCPTVLVYRVGAVTAAIARRVITGVKHVGLANVVAEKAGVECPMPELLQEDFTVEAVVGHVEKWLRDSAARDEAAAKLDRTMALLKGGSDPIGRMADIVMGVAK